ncbi:MAG TPA: hypothetical protein VEJ63_17470 [Planctomycetota bacterium]|nr:hypothetical protein [Planctomycetota bacterium]
MLRVSLVFAVLAGTLIGGEAPPPVAHGGGVVTPDGNGTGGGPQQSGPTWRIYESQSSSIEDSRDEKYNEKKRADQLQFELPPC